MKQLCNDYKKVPEIRNLKRIRIYKELKETRAGQRTIYLTKLFETFKYETDSDTGVILLKKGKNHPKLLQLHSLGRDIADAKKKDIDNLLVKQFGNKWRDIEELQWYVGILDNSSSHTREVGDAGEVSENEECDCLEPETNTIRI